MSKFNQIENKLKELDGGTFQKLADVYLYKKGYEQINPLGSVTGSNKVRKGTPDTFVTLPNGKYAFAEYTTQQEGLYKKLKSDLDKCFNEAKTGVPIKKIEEIVVCHTSILNPDEEDKLREECQKRKVNLSIFGIGRISQDLYQKYPQIARDFLNIEVDTGQVIPTDEFVSIYNKNALATPLNTIFHFREEEVKKALQGLTESNLVIVSGRAGVGKSRFALECCDQFLAENPDYKVRCIFNKGRDLFDDLRVHFAEPGHHLIFVDDANRINRFEYVLQLLHDTNENRVVKVIATVRDYALDKVRKVARPFGGGTEVELQPLEEKQIKQFILEEFGISNQLCLDRIADIAQGNPRLAIMAAKVAKRENTLQSISDVSTLYDEYYSSIRQDLEALGELGLLKVAGIVAFFRVVDRSNKEMMNAIEAAFGISPEALWEAARRLHDYEILDMYKQEVVRISDQVLATYLFYLTFFKERTLSFTILLEYFFPRLRHRLIDALNPVMNAFYSKALMDAIRPHVDRAWKALEEADNQEGLLHLMEVFWFLKETDILLYVKGRISEMNAESLDLSKMEIKADSNIPSPSLLSVLSSFKYSDESMLRISVGLLLDYLTKRPNDLPKVLHLLTNDFGFTYTSYTQGFVAQQKVVDVLWERTREGTNGLFSKLFLAIAEQYLHTLFHTAELKGGHAFTMINFKLRPTPDLFELRRKIWSQLFHLYRKPSLREDMLGVLHSYCTSGYAVSIHEIVAQDAAEVLPFIASELDPSSYRHCHVVQGFLNLLRDRGVSFDEELRKRFRNEAYTLSELLLFDWAEKKNLNLEIGEYRQLKKERIKQYFSSYNFADFKQFFERCLEIQEGLYQSHEVYQLQEGVTDVFCALADRDSHLYAEVLEHYLELGDPLKLNSYRPIERLVEVCGAERAYGILNRPHYLSKRKWLFGFYRSLPPKETTAKRLDQLYTLYREATREDLPYDMDFLLKYRPLDERVVAHVTDIILKKAGKDPNYASALSPLFNPYAEANKNLLDLFYDEIDLLKQAYFAVLEMDWHEDYDGQALARILDISPDFILEYIDWVYESKERLNRYDDTRDYSFLWKRDNYKNLMIRVVEKIYRREQERITFWNTYLEAFFMLSENGKDNLTIREKQDQFLGELIQHRHGDLNFMEFVFSVITRFSPDRRRSFVVLFLQHNKNFKDFARLPLESDSWGWSGSAVPMLQGRVEYFESLLPFLNTVDFLQHKQYVERRIQGLREEIEREKKRDFMED